MGAFSKRLFIVAAFGAVLAADPLSAQENGIERATLQDQQGPCAGYHSLTVKTGIAPGKVIAPHTHPGLENAYVETGKGEVTIAGKGKTPLSTGDSFAVPANTVHSVTNTGADKLVVISTYVVEQSQPLSSPAK